MTIHPTKYAEIGYACTAPSLWRFIDVETGKEVGPQYRSRHELLADVDSYYQRAWA